MTFDSSLLETYRTLLNTTPLQQSYQEFVRLFRYLRSELERQLPDFRFQSSICENAMEYAYFFLTSPALKEKGWKLVVVFIHKSFQLEVWLSGSNRSIQRQWANRLNACPPPMEASADPGRTEYLIRLPVQTDLTNGKGTAAAIRKAVKDLTEFLSSQGGTI